jgi:hypothetical protein
MSSGVECIDSGSRIEPAPHDMIRIGFGKKKLASGSTASFARIVEPHDDEGRRRRRTR